MKIFSTSVKTDDTGEVARIESAERDRLEKKKSVSWFFIVFYYSECMQSAPRLSDTESTSSSIVSSFTIFRSR